MPPLKSFFFVLFILLISATSFAQAKNEANCFSMLAGNAATKDGSVLLAHNEDDWGELYVDWHKVPRIKHEKGEKVMLENGGMVDQVAESYSFLWLQMPGMQFSDSYMNEWGVTIASNQCKSREDNAVLTDGGIGYYLRRLMAERAKTAREAVEIGGQLVEEFGYHYSGRTYIIADPNEAWMMSVVKGKHWIAQRIPNEHIAIIPNYYTIQEIDLRDSVNYLGAKDIITYALDRGWFDPEKEERFNFRNAYAEIESLYGIWNIPRHLDIINHFSEKKYGYRDQLPFSFAPMNKISHADIMNVLDTHGEGSQFEVSANYKNGNPHSTDIKRTCSEGNQYGMVAQLRKDLPAPISNVMWLAPKRPCIQPFTPWYIGIERIAPDYSRGNPAKCLESHFTDTSLRSQTEDKAYWAFRELADRCDNNYNANYEAMKAFKDPFQKAVLEQQSTFEDVFISMYEQDQNQAIEILNSYVQGLANKLLESTRERIKLMDEGNEENE